MKTIFNLLRKFKGYRTIIASLVLALVGAGQVFGIVLDQDTTMGVVDAVFALVVALLRFDTNTPVGDSGQLPVE